MLKTSAKMIIGPKFSTLKEIKSIIKLNREKKAIEKINESKSWFFKKINKSCLSGSVG